MNYSLKDFHETMFEHQITSISKLDINGNPTRLAKACKTIEVQFCNGELYILSYEDFNNYLITNRGMLC